MVEGGENSVTPSPALRKRKHEDAVDAFRSRTEMLRKEKEEDMQLRRAELELKKQELDLQRQQWVFERELRQKREERESEERLLLFSWMKKQQEK